MPELKRIFINGKMDIDLDDRLVPSGSYRFAENIAVSRSPGADVGAVENIQGTQQIDNDYGVFGTSSSEAPTTVGAVRDDFNNSVYWFFISRTQEGIYEFDLSEDTDRFLTGGIIANPNFGLPRNVVSRIVEFTRDQQILKFDVDNLITGANIINNLLYWTDGFNPPRKINLDRFRGSGNYYTIVAGNAGPTVTGSVRSVPDAPDTLIPTTRLVSDPNPSYDGNEEALIDLDTLELDVVQRPAFYGDLISVAKRPPLFPPVVTSVGSTSPNVIAGTILGQTYTSTPTTTDWEGEIFFAVNLVGNYQNPIFRNVQIFNVSEPWELLAPNLTVTTQAAGATTATARDIYQWQLGDLQSDITEDFVYFPLVTTAGLGNNGYNNLVLYIGDTRLPADTTVVISSNPRLDIDVSEDPSDSGDYLYDNFVYFAYRYKYRDGEVTPLSPFSPPIFIPRDYNVQRNPASLLSMVNRLASAEITYDVGNQEVTEIELVVTSSRDITLKSLVTINKAENDIISSTPYRSSVRSFIYDNNKVYRTLPERELTRIYDDVPLTAKAQEIIGNRLVYGNYVQNYNITTIGPNGNAIVPTYNVSLPPQSERQRDSATRMATPNLKSDRDYQVGVVYLDSEGRQSPVLLTDEGDSSNSSTVHVPFADHQLRNRLRVTMKSAAPYWATHYRFFVKQTQSEFYNIYPKGVVRGINIVGTNIESNRLFVRLDSSEVDKIQADTVLILKGTDTNGVESNARRTYRVDPYTQAGQNSSGFLPNSDNQVIFDVPFDVVQRDTNNVFAPLTNNEGQQSYSFGTFTENSFGYRIDAPEGSSNIAITGVTDSAGTALAANQFNAFGIFVNFILVGTSPGIADGAAFIVNYTYDTQDLGHEARDDYYLSVVPVDASDINEFPSSPIIDTQVIFETTPLIDSVLNIYHEHGDTFRCANGAHTNSKAEFVKSTDICQTIYRDGEDGVEGEAVPGSTGETVIDLENYWNCFSYTNGIEEDKVLGKFRGITLRPGIKASTINEDFRQTSRESWLIHSGVYTDSTNLNRLNDFHPGELISKELDFSEGSIQKIHSRNTNLIVFQEDKVKNVPIQKNLIQTAGSQSLLATDSQFFGTEGSYTGEYGISTNPESFCTYGSKIYFADKNRGALCRLSSDGITEISQYGLEAYTKDVIRDAQLIFGSYDDFNDQAHFSFRNALQNPNTRNTTTAIQLSEDGSPGPRSECNRNEDLLQFRRFFLFNARPMAVVEQGDAIFIDAEATTPFNGNYRWYRIQDDVGTMVDGVVDRYNRIVQISPFGVVTGIITNCSVGYPPDLPRDSFDISSIGFMTEFEACANGIVDSQAYHNGQANEPIVGNRIYEGRHDRIQSSRCNWYTISVGTTKYTIKIVNGLVTSKINCLDTTAGRRSLLGSTVRIIRGNESEGARNIRLCNAAFAEEIWWHDGANARPEIDDIIFEDNIRDVLATNAESRTLATRGAAGFIAFAEGYFVRVTADSVVDLVGFCSADVCFNTPLNLFTSSDSNPFEFTFTGVRETYDISTDGTVPVDLGGPQSIPNAEISYIVQGQNRYPASGEYTVNAQVGTINELRTNLYYDSRLSSSNRDTTLGGEIVVPLRLGPEFGFENDTFTLPSPDDPNDLSQPLDTRYEDEDGEIEVIITNVCYRGIADTGAEIVYLTDVWDGLDPTTDGELCGNEATTTVYYFPREGRRFYDDQNRADFTGTAGTYGLANIIDPAVTGSDDGGIVDEVVTIAADGTVTGGFQCIGSDDTYLISLGFTSEVDTSSIQRACNAFEFMTMSRVDVYSDQPLENFADDTPETTSNPGNPPTGLFLANGDAQPPGTYAGGIYPGNNDADGMLFPQGNYITRFWNGTTLSAANAEGCSVALTATITATETVPIANPDVTITFLTTNGEGTTSTNGQAVGDIDESWTIVSTINPPTGMRFVGTPTARFAEGSDALANVTLIQSGNSWSYSWTGMWELADIDNEPTASIVFDGTLEAIPTGPTTYTVTLRVVNGITGAEVTGGGSISGIMPGESRSITGGVQPSIGTNGVLRTFVGTPTYVVGSGGSIQNGSSYTHSFNNIQGNLRVDVAFSGSTLLGVIAPPARTFTLTATESVDNATVSSASQVASLTSGSSSLSVSLNPDAGWLLSGISPASPYTYNFNYTDSVRTNSVNFTGSTVRPSFSARSGSSEAAACADTTTSTFYSTTGTIGTGTLLTGSTALTSSTHGDIYLVSVGSTSGHRWSGSAWSTFTCPTAPTRTLQTFTRFSGSSARAVCTLSSNNVTVWLDSTDNFYYTTEAGSTRISQGFYRAGGATSASFYTFSSNSFGTATTCPGIYRGGVLIADGGTVDNNTNTGAGNQDSSETIVVAGTGISIQGGGGFSATSSSGITGNVRILVDGTQRSTANAANSGFGFVTLSYSPSEISLADGTYTIILRNESIVGGNGSSTYVANYS